MTTIRVLFDRKDAAPSDLKLKRAFGVVYPAYRELLASIEDYPREWKFYGPKFGWQLKVAQKKKALFYLIPQVGSFMVGFAVRDKEKDILVNSKLPVKTKAELMGAKRYPEGYPLRLWVKKASDMRGVRLIVDTLKAMRT